MQSDGIAEGSEATYQLLTNVQARPPRQLKPFSFEVLAFQPEARVELDTAKFIKNLRSARRGLSPGLGGFRNEHLKILLEDDAGLDALCIIAQHFADADIPADIVAALRLGKMTALRKSESKVRGP